MTRELVYVGLLCLMGIGLVGCNKEANTTSTGVEATQQVEVEVASDNSTEAVQTEVEPNTETIENTGQVSEQETPTEQVTTEQTTQAEVAPQATEGLIGVGTVEESLLNYQATDMSVSGTITDKKILDLGTSQYIYYIEITSVLGNNKTVFQYYCTYNTYNEVNLNDLVLVTYKQVTDDNYIICSVSK